MHKKMIVVAVCSAGVAVLLFLFPVLFPHVEGQWTYNLDNVWGVQDVVVQENYAYATCNREDSHTGLSNQLAVVDIWDPTNPHVITYRNYTGFASGVLVVGNYAYLACNDSGLAIIDVGDPTAEGQTVYSSLTGKALGVAVSGSYAYVACNESGLAVISVSNPLTPGPSVYCSLTGRALGVAVSESFAYVACSDKNLAVIDISNPMSPEAPVYRGVLDTAYDVAVAGDRAYVACGAAGLAIINVSNPMSPGVPVYRNTTAMSMDARYVSIVQSQVYLGAEYLYIVDISDPSNPGSVGVSGCLNGICGSHVALGPTRLLCGTHVFMVCSERVTVCNLGGYIPNGYPIGFAFVPAIIAGIAIMVGKEQSPKSDSGYETDSTGGLRVSNNYVY